MNKYDKNLELTLLIKDAISCDLEEDPMSWYGYTRLCSVVFLRKFSHYFNTAMSNYVETEKLIVSGSYLKFTILHISVSQFCNI